MCLQNCYVTFVHYVRKNTLKKFCCWHVYIDDENNISQVNWTTGISTSNYLVMGVNEESVKSPVVQHGPVYSCYMTLYSF